MTDDKKKQDNPSADDFSDEPKEEFKEEKKSEKSEEKESKKSEDKKSKKEDHHKKQEDSGSKKIWFLLGAVALVVIVYLIFSAGQGLKIAEQVNFGENDKIMLDVKGQVDTDQVRLYTDSGKTTAYSQGEDYLVDTEDKQGDTTRLIVERIQDGSIKSGQSVFLYYNPKKAVAPESNDEPSEDNTGDEKETSGKTVAVVNDEKITDEELLSEYNSFFIVSGYPEMYKSIITLKKYVNQSIVEHLLMQEAESQGLSVSDEEVNQLLENYLKNKGQSMEEFESSIEKKDVELKDVKDFFRRNILTSKLLNKTVPQIEVSEEDISTYYEENIDQFTTPEQVNTSHILICHENSTRCASNLTKEEAEAKAEEVKDMLDEEDFAELAKEHSNGPSASKGGNLGMVQKGAMVPEFEEAAFGLEAGEVTGPVETQFGQHIIKVHEKTEESVKDLEEVREQIRQALTSQKQREKVQEYLEELKADAEIKIYTDKISSNQSSGSQQQMISPKNIQVNQE